VNNPIHIIIGETSSLIFEGLSAILLKSGMPVHILRAGNLGDTEKIILSHKKSLVIINPSLLQNNIKLFNTLKSDHLNTKWIAVIYAFYDTQLVSLFDGVINIYDPPDTIIAFIKKTIALAPNLETVKTEEVLSEREIEVLQLLATGLANKSIADKLNISINTVITHRKNISQKTGIKSVSGLTIYAVVKKLITLDNIS
jgi:DNA-binding NarL/FixJ family response regulator